MSELPVITAGLSRVGFVCAGDASFAMARHALDAGHHVTLCTIESADDAGTVATLVSRGARLVATPGACAEISDVVVVATTCARESKLAADDGLARMRSGGLWVDVTETCDPNLARSLASEAARHGVHTIDAPLDAASHTGPSAQFSLVTCVGASDARAARAIAPLLVELALGRGAAAASTTELDVGPAGTGQEIAIARATAGAVAMIGLAEALIVAQRGGVSADVALRAISASSASSWAAHNWGPRLTRRAFAPATAPGGIMRSAQGIPGGAGASVRAVAKALRAASRHAAEQELALPAQSVASQLFVASLAAGDGDLGPHAVIRSAERLNVLRAVADDDTGGLTPRPPPGGRAGAGGASAAVPAGAPDPLPPPSDTPRAVASPRPKAQFRYDRGGASDEGRK